MGFAEFAARREELNSQFNTIEQVLIGRSKGNVLSVDENHDNNYEVQKVYSESGNSIFENFDFDSNGAIDYARYFHEKGNQFAEYFYSNNPENNEEYKPTLIEKIGSFFGVDSKRENEIRAKADEFSSKLPDDISDK